MASLVDCTLRDPELCGMNILVVDCISYYIICSDYSSTVFRVPGNLLNAETYHSFKINFLWETTGCNFELFFFGASSK